MLKIRIETARRLRARQRDSKDKLHAVHAPEVECIAEGGAGSPYEFGLKTSVAVTAKAGAVAAMRSMPGSPYDGHRRRSQLEQRRNLTGGRPAMALPSGVLGARRRRMERGC